MTVSCRAGAGHPPRLTTLHALLDALAKRTATGVITPASDGTRTLSIVRADMPAAFSREAAWVVVVQARDSGLIEPTGETGDAFVLSRAGRAVLRRHRSATDAAGEPSAASLAARSAAPPPPAPPPPPLPSPTARIDPAESPLAWFRRRRDKSGAPMITAIQFDAGERLRADFNFAAMSPRVTVNWSPTAGCSSGRSGGGLGIEMRDTIASAQMRVRRALGAVGPTSAGLLLDVCGFLRGLEEVERARGWPPRSGKIALQMALSELARHYRLPGSDAGSERVAAKLRHWGEPDYRPTVDAGGST